MEEVYWEVMPGPVKDISREHGLDCLGCLVPGADLAFLDIVSYICVYSRPVDG